MALIKLGGLHKIITEPNASIWLRPTLFSPPPNAGGNSSNDYLVNLLTLILS